MTSVIEAKDSMAATKDPKPTPSASSTGTQTGAVSGGSATAVQVAPFPKTVPVRAPAAPPKPQFNPDRVAKEIGRLDRALLGILLLLAFLLASFVARNTDVWMHLANGRAPRARKRRPLATRSSSGPGRHRPACPRNLR